MYDLQKATDAVLMYVREMKALPANASGNKTHGIYRRCLNKLEKAGCSRNEATELMRNALK